jgi:hypothetical protein
VRERSISVVALIAGCALFASCAGLSESAQNVKYVTKSEAPTGCKEIGEVSTGSLMPMFDMTSVKNSLRNKTAEMGGNYLVVDEIKNVSGSNGSSNGYAGSGRAYQSPQS